MAFPWTDGAIEQLKKLRAEGLTASEIAARLPGASRSAVLGKLFRLGLHLSGGNETRRQTSRINGRANAKRRPKFNFARTDHSPRRRASAPAESSELSPLADGLGLPNSEPFELHSYAGDPPYAECLSIDQLKDAHCRWPIGEPTRFCGREHLPGLPYCLNHALRAYRPANTSTKGKDVHHG